MSHDTIMALKSESFGLRVFEVPDDWIRPHEDDRLKERVRSLEKKVAALKTNQPEIKLWFESAKGTQIRLLTGQKFSEQTLEEAEIGKILETEENSLALHSHLI